MPYDAFGRGPLPVGVRGGQLVDRQRADRLLPFEVWYPADARYAGLDLDPASQDSFTGMPGAPPMRQAAVRDAAARAGNYPLILFSHTSAGHRRQSTFLCTHLASHGYIVAGVDHTGNTAADAAARAATGSVFTPAERDAYVERIIADRVPDVRFLLDSVLSGAAADVALHIDALRIGLVGWSFGGWTVLAIPEQDARCRAIVALAPGGNSRPLPGIIPATLTFAWQREVPTLLLVAEHDRFTPLPAQYELFERTPSSKQMFILRQADHGHFADLIEEPGGCSTEAAHAFTRSLALAHLDAVLNANPEARHFLLHDTAGPLLAHGVDAFQYAPAASSD